MSEERTERQEPDELPELRMVINPGSASSEEIGEFLFELSELYREMGGPGLEFVPLETRATQGETA